jgi:hypothetical protein
VDGGETDTHRHRRTRSAAEAEVSWQQTLTIHPLSG